MKNQLFLFPWPPPLPVRAKRQPVDPEKLASANAFIDELENDLREYIASLQPDLPFPEELARHSNEEKMKALYLKAGGTGLSLLNQEEDNEEPPAPAKPPALPAPVEPPARRCLALDTEKRAFFREARGNSILTPTDRAALRNVNHSSIFTPADRAAIRESRRRKKPYSFHFPVPDIGVLFFPGPLRVKMIPYGPDPIESLGRIVDELKHYSIADLWRRASQEARSRPPSEVCAMMYSKPAPWVAEYALKRQHEKVKARREAFDKRFPPIKSRSIEDFLMDQARDVSPARSTLYDRFLDFLARKLFPVYELINELKE